jgi:hypothetical protein
VKFSNGFVNDWCNLTPIPSPRVEKEARHKRQP